nr:hypothetical protein [Nanoarchaeum sp.]
LCEVKYYTNGITNEKIYEYDNKGRLIATIENIGRLTATTEYVYDDAGNAVSITYPSGEIVEYSYDEFNKINSVELPSDSSIWTIDFNSDGTVDEITYPSNNLVEHSYNSENQLIDIVVTDDSSTVLFEEEYDYDNFGNVIDINNEEVIFDYDDVYRLKSIYDSGYYDVNGHSITSIDYTYDSVGNRLSRDFVGSSNAVESQDYTYHQGSDILEHTNDCVYDYDAIGSVVGENCSGNYSEYVYGNDGRLSVVWDKDRNAVDFVYDTNGQRIIKKVYKEGEYYYKTNYLYGAGNLPIVELTTCSADLDYNGIVDLNDLVIFSGYYGNGYHKEIDFFPDGVIEISDVSIFVTQYGLQTTDACLGNIGLKKESIDNAEDSKDELDEIVVPSDELEITNIEKDNNETINSTELENKKKINSKDLVEDSDLIKEEVVVINEYDDEDKGDDPEDVVIYDDYTYEQICEVICDSEELQLIDVCKCSKLDEKAGVSLKTIESTIDLSKVGGWTNFFYSGSKLLGSQHNDELTEEYQDHLGSNRLATDSSGSIIGEFKALPFGQPLLESGERFTFTGKEFDESSLYYYGARYYNPDLGRFTSVDPVASEPAYQYVGNNPVNMIDPSGKLPELTAQLMLNAQRQGRFEEYEQIQQAAGIEGLKMLGDYTAGELSLGLSDLGQAIVGQDLYGQEVGTFGRVLMLAGAAPLVPSMGSVAKYTLKEAEDLFDAGSSLKYSSLPTEMRHNLDSWGILESEGKKSDILIKLLGSKMDNSARIMSDLDAAGIDRGAIRRIGGENPKQGISGVQGGRFVKNKGNEHKWLNLNDQVVSSIPMHQKTIAPGTAAEIKSNLGRWALDSYHSSYTPDGTISIEKQFLMRKRPNNFR